MDRVNGNNTVDIGGGRRGFKSQNAAAGVPGTEVTDKILNDVQEEICSVIENSGFALDPENQQQLWEALQSIAAPGFANRSAWLPVISLTTTAPPNGAVLGDAYVIPAGASGSWADHQQKLAEWTGSRWRIVNTKNGHGISLPDGRVFEKVGGIYVEKIAMDVQSGKWSYAIATGTANAIKVTMVPPITSYTDGLVVRARVPLKNTTAVTLDAGAGPAEIATLTGGALQNGDLQALGVYTFVFVDGYWRMPIESQRVLTGDIDLYVRADGNDANDGFANSASRAFRTIQYAVDQAQKRFISAGFKIRINVGNGVFSAFSLTGSSGSLIEVVGNTATPSACAITGTAGKAVIFAGRGSSLTVRGFKLSDGLHLLQAQDRSSITASSIEFGTCSQYQVVASANSIINFDGPCAVSGNAASFLVATTGGSISAAGQSFNFTTTVNYSTCTVWANGAKIIMQSATFINAVNVGGTRYLVDIVGSIYTAGGGANFIPGTIAGTVNSGGVYI